ncbi:MAG: deoxyribonuclease IV [Erysipelotrichaceae bacterium]|nr:deoxyribonuclease IV [Erysipelotrichaceae bacterium]
MLKIGSHVSMSGPDYILGSVNEALAYKANALMLYTGAPQNSFRIPVERLKIEEGISKWKESGCDVSDIIIHCPYIINLANTLKPETFESGKEVLRREIDRTMAIGARYMVLHPGSSLTGDVDESLKQVADGLNEIIREDDSVVICLETMAGKGSEVGRTFEQIKTIIDNVSLKDKMGVCLDTCHIHDAGYDLNDFDSVLKQFDEIIGLKSLYVVHVNDSKNVKGAHKDRHANIGYGEIGFAALNKVVHHPLLDNIPMILETPYINSQSPYGYEIENFRNGEFREIPL